MPFLLSLHCLLLLMAEAISPLDIYLCHRSWPVQRVQYIYLLHHLLRISTYSSSFRSRGLDRNVAMVEVSLVIAEEEGAGT